MKIAMALSLKVIFQNYFVIWVQLILYNILRVSRWYWTVFLNWSMTKTWLCKIPKFHLISSCENFVETQNFQRVAGVLSKTLRKLCVSAKSPQRKIRWDYKHFIQCLLATLFIFKTSKCIYFRAFVQLVISWCLSAGGMWWHATIRYRIFEAGSSFLVEWRTAGKV